LWEQLLGQAQSEHRDETSLMIRAIEQYLQQETAKIARAERLQRECEELANLEFDDVGTEDEWLIIQNEALAKAEIDLA
jgi:hypothetical protein